MNEHFAWYKEVLDEASPMWQSEVLLHTGGTKKRELFSIQYFDSLPVNAESL